MKNIKKYFIALLSFLLILTISSKLYSQSDEELKAMWIFNIAAGTNWENEKDISEYTIGVFSSEEEYIQIKKLAENRKINKKPVKVVRYYKHEEINPNHIVFVTKNKNAYLGFVYNKLKSKNVLIISDQSHQPEYSVINLNKPGEGTQPFSINSRLYEEQRLDFSVSLLRLGGDREILNKIYAESRSELRKVKKESEIKDQKIKELENIIKEQEIKIKKQEEMLKNK